MLLGKASKKGDIMENRLNTLKNNKCLYTFYSAKKIFLAHTPSKFILMEKLEDHFAKKSLSLVSRNTVVISKNGGVLLFPRNK